ncbi:protein rep [Arenibaculum sp.]|uniref:protein rep n=1 Tax=Arenibaculum sp. TaxID=2865862 RepID=UPI002E1139E5|nr:protein rep [Arenibaculum sp.]
MRISDRGAAFGGVMTCGSVWMCPVCAAKVTEGRRQEVAQAIEAHLAAGGRVYMAAFTAPHDRRMTAQELRGLIAGSWRRMQGGKRWKAAKVKADLVGTVRALEVTHGDHGWHPHLHVLFFFGADADPDEVDAFGVFLFEQWARIIRKLGYGECNPAVWRFEEARSSDDAGDYVAKWGADREVTKGHAKLGRKGGRSPWQILTDIAAGDRRSIMLFREYAAAFKGARQLTWSGGLKQRYGIVDVSDEVIAETAAEHEEAAPLAGRLQRHVADALFRRRLHTRFLEALERRNLWLDALAFLRRYGIDPDGPPPEHPRDAATRREWATYGHGGQDGSPGHPGMDRAVSTAA